jgi:hypothetical protein
MGLMGSLTLVNRHQTRPKLRNTAKPEYQAEHQEGASGHLPTHRRVLPAGLKKTEAEASKLLLLDPIVKDSSLRK